MTPIGTSAAALVAATALLLPGPLPVAVAADPKSGPPGADRAAAAPAAGTHEEPEFIVTLEPATLKLSKTSVHDGEEFIFVLEGEMEVILGDHRDILYPGDSIYYDSSIPHRVQCHQDKLTRIHVRITSVLLWINVLAGLGAGPVYPTGDARRLSIS